MSVFKADSPSCPHCGKDLPSIDPDVAAAALNLTPMESRVAVLLAEGMRVREIAVAMGRGESTIRSHVKRMFKKHGLFRQAGLARLVLSVEVPKRRKRPARKPISLVRP